MPMPHEIIGLLRSRITFKWADGHETVYPARMLRLACRCAGCVEETSGQPLLDPKTVAETVRAKGIELIGQYAIQIEWSDGHSTGIFNFRDLRANCPCETCAAERAAGRVPQSPS
jgi:ATP-binding protein involved in chromosome partitioning